MIVLGDMTYQFDAIHAWHIQIDNADVDRRITVFQNFKGGKPIGHFEDVLHTEISQHNG